MHRVQNWIRIAIDAPSRNHVIYDALNGPDAFNMIILYMKASSCQGQWRQETRHDRLASQYVLGYFQEHPSQVTQDGNHLDYIRKSLQPQVEGLQQFTHKA
jgi:hypothetical protein